MELLWEPDSPDAPKESVPFARVVGAVFLLLLLRRPEALLRAQFWAEDGSVVFKDQLTVGFLSAALRTYNGPPDLFPRIVGWLLSPVPPGFAPFAYNLVALFIGALCVSWLARREYRRILPSDTIRILAAMAIASSPTGRQLVGSLTNTNWYLLWLGFLLLLAPLPRSSAGRGAFIGAWILIGLSTPGAVAYVPFWLLRMAVRRDERAVGAACVVPILLMVLLTDRARVGTTRAPLEPGAAIVGVGRLFAWRIVAEPFVGESDRLGLARFGLPVVGASALLVGTSWVMSFRHSDRRARAWLLVALLVALALFALTCAGRPDVIRVASGDLTTVGGGRYFFVPVGIVILGFFVALARAENKIVPAAILVVFTASILMSFRAHAWVDYDWPWCARELEKAMAERRTATLVFPLNPPGHPLRIDLVDGAPVASGA